MNRSSLILVVLLGTAVAVAGATTCTVVVNGSKLESDTAFCTTDGELMLTAIGLRQGLGLTVEHESDNAPWTIRGFGRTLQVRPGTSAYTVEGELRHAQQECLMQADGVAVPLSMVQEAFYLEAKLQQEGEARIWTLTSPGTMITDVRQGAHRDRVRLVLDLSRATAFSWRSTEGLLTIELPAPRDNGGWSRSVRLLHFDDSLVAELRQGPTGGGTIRVEIVHHSQQPPQIFTLAEPPRIVIDLLRNPEDIIPEPAPIPPTPLPGAAGVFQSRNFSTPRGPVRVYVLDVDPRSEAIDVRPVLAAATLPCRATVSRMVAATGAWGGVNGGFFSREGQPLGMLVIDGEWIREPIGGRTVLGITTEGDLLMDRLTFNARVVFAGLGRQILSAINRGHERPDTMVMLTRRYGEFVPGAPGRTRLAVDASGVVVAKETNGAALRIPEGGFVLSGIGRMAASLRMVEVGTAVSVELRTKPYWPNLRHAIGGGPRLVKDGQEHITAIAEHFRPDVYASRRSRTAVGITRDGRLLLVAVEALGAPGGGERDGMTLQELARTMIKLGAWQAMNLDGGGSTTFVADRRLLNTPDDGAARSVCNALLVFVREVATTGGG